jgi:hypothetical protein
VLGRGGTVLGLAAAVLLTAGGVSAAFAVQPAPQQAPVSQPTTRVETVIDQPSPPEATTTTVPTPPPAPSPTAAGSGAATVTVIINRPG